MGTLWTNSTMGTMMIKISNQYAGKRVRIQGVIPIDDDNPTIGQGNHVGVVESVEGRKFRFKDDGDTYCAHLSCSMWRIVEVFPS
jgi:hypothetical protein